jgi:hypothetical protein
VSTEADSFRHRSQVVASAGSPGSALSLRGSVFRVIQDFHRALLQSGCLAPREQIYLTRRIDRVEEEVAAVGDLAASRDPTETRRCLAAALQAA